MLKELLKAGRSYRSFDASVKIPQALLEDWVDCTRYCPSSINLQMLKFRIVTDAAECADLLEATRWAGKIKDQKLPPEGHAPTAYIVVCSDRNVIATADTFQKDVGIVSQTIMLAACESGFGGCMIGSFSPDNVRTLLRLPDALTPQLILALGRPDECVALTDPAEDGSVTYYRENGVHYVQKRTLEQVLIK